MIPFLDGNPNKKEIYSKTRDFIDSQLTIIINDMCYMSVILSSGISDSILEFFSKDH